MRWDWHTWGRYRQIAEILGRHGFFFVLDSLGLSRHLPWGWRMRQSPAPPIDARWPERLRLVLADLGPTYIKLGQLASTRSDVLPPDVVQSLEHLQDDVPPFDFSEVTRILANEWGADYPALVEHVDPEPLAAASIGQVHRARLADGRAIVVKVRRPGIVEQSEADFRILRTLAELAEHRWSWAQEAQLTEVVEELISALREEMDFTIEARNTDTGRANLTDSDEVVVPEVIWSLTRSSVLVLEDLPGEKITDGAALARTGREPGQLARTLVAVIYRQIFEQGFFHADPHPGNIHLDAEGRLIFLDWGLVGVLSRIMRHHSVDLVLGLAQGDSELVADALMAMNGNRWQTDRMRLVRDIERLRHRYYEAQLGSFPVGQALSDIFRVARRHHLQVPSEYLLLARTAVILDGVVRQLDPAFSLVELGKPMALELIRQRLDPRDWLGPAVGAGRRSLASLMALPGELERTLATLSRGEVRIVLEHRNMDHILWHWEKLANRIALSFLLGAIVLGTAWVVRRQQLTHLPGLPFGTYAFVVTLVLAAGLFLAAVRRGRL